MENLLKQYLPMIRKAAWQASRMWKQEYEEALSIAYEVFIETLGKYDDKRNVKFGTYLYHRLRKVNEKCKSQHQKKKNECSTTILINIIDKRIFNIFKERLEFYDSSETELSLKARELLNWLLTTEHEKNRASFHRTRKHFTQVLNWKFKDLQQAWNEIHRWWNENNFVLG